MDAGLTNLHLTDDLSVSHLCCTKPFDPCASKVGLLMKLLSQ